MARHIVVGQGNLGADLADLLGEQEADYFIASKELGFQWPGCGLDDLVALHPDVVWLCVGSGGVLEAQCDYSNALCSSAGLFTDCLMRFPEETSIVAFSTDHCANETHPTNPGLHTMNPRSLFAHSKLHMERVLKFIDRPNSSIIRLGTLYGKSRPMRTFPGRLLSQFPRQTTIPLPMNLVTPTPTDWLADMLLKRSDAFLRGGPKICHAAPSGNVSIADWGKMVLGPEFTIKERELDETRPAGVSIGCSLGPVSNWLDLWNQRGRKIFNLST